MKLEVSEMFFSHQSEGARSGTPTFFIRLKGCKAKNACYSMGIKCDTEFESGSEIDVEELHSWMNLTNLHCNEITWTGGEPAQQLTKEIIQYFKDKGYYQAIETSGLFPVPENMDFICVSPKVAEHVVKKNFPNGVSELRYVRHKGQFLPEPSIKAEHYWLSPHFDGYELNEENLKHCIKLSLDNPKWKVSVQEHKLWNIL